SAERLRRAGVSRRRVPDDRVELARCAGGDRRFRQGECGDADGTTRGVGGGGATEERRDGDPEESTRTHMGNAYRSPPHPSTRKEPSSGRSRDDGPTSTPYSIGSTSQPPVPTSQKARSAARRLKATVRVSPGSRCTRAKPFRSRTARSTREPR